MGEILHFGKMGVKGVAVCATFAAVALLASSCVRRELHVKPDEGHVILDFDWQNIVPGGSVPDKMSVYFYGADGTLKREVVENGRFGVTLASGDYKVLTLNEEAVSSSVGFTNMEDFDRAYAYALPLNKKAEGEEFWIQQPGMLYSANLTDLTVNKEDTVARTFVPASLVRWVILKIRFTGDADRVTNVSAALTGVAPAVRLATLEHIDGVASITEFEPKLSTEETGLYTASVLVFGVSAKDATGAVADNTVRLGVNFDNNGSQTLEEGIEIEEGTGDIEIDVELAVEVAATSQGGFVAKVTKWEVTTDGMEVDNRP